MVFTKFSPDQVERNVLCLALHCAHEAGINDESLVTRYEMTRYMLRQIRRGAEIRDYVLNYARLACAIDDRCLQLGNSGHTDEAERLHSSLHELNMRFMKLVRNVKI